MSLKVIIKVDTVITAAETERETSLESDMCGVARTAGAGAGTTPTHVRCPPRLQSLVREPGPPGTPSKTKLNTGGRHKPPVTPDTVNTGLTINSKHQ